MPKFQKVRQNPPRLAKFRGMGSCFCCTLTSRPKFVRVLSGNRKGGKKTLKSGSPTGGRCSPANSASNPSHEVAPQHSPEAKETQSDGQGAERCHQHPTSGCLSSHKEPVPAEFFELGEPDRLPELEELTGLAELPELPSFADFEELNDTLELPECPSWDVIQEPTAGTGEEWWEVLFSRALGSFPSYSRRMMRNIHTRWGRFRARHPAAVRYAKGTSWLSGIAASVGSAVSLPVELYRTFHALNQTDEEIRNKIENVTAHLEDLQKQSEEEFQEYPDQTIYDLYHWALRRDERGVYRLGFEDLPRSEEDPTAMDPTFQDIPGFPPEIEEVERIMRTTTTTTTATSTTSEFELWTPQPHINQVSHLEKGFTLADATLNATRSPSVSQDLETDWFEIWDGVTPILLGWIIVAMAGFIILLSYAAFVLCIRRCCVFIRRRVSHRATDYPRALPQEPIELSNIPLDGFNNVNLYEVIPVTQPVMAEPPVPAVPLSQ